MSASMGGGDDWAARLKGALATTQPAGPAAPPEGGLLGALAPREPAAETRPSLLDALSAPAASGLLASLAGAAPERSAERPAPPPSPLLAAIRPPREPAAGSAPPSPLLAAIRPPSEPAAASAPAPPAGLLERPAPPSSPLLGAISPPVEPAAASPPPALLHPVLAAPPPVGPPPVEPTHVEPPPPAPPAAPSLARSPADIFELMVGRAPTPDEAALLAKARDAAALRQVIAALPAFRNGVLGRALTAELRQGTTRPSEAEIAALDALGAAAPGEPGMVVDWFGLRIPLAIAPELAGHAGQVLPRPLPQDPRAPAAAWIGLAQSISTARGQWRALALGAGRGDLLLAGAVAARRRGLTPILHLIEPDRRAFALLLRLAKANGIDPAAHDLRQADPAAIRRDALATEAAWDFVWCDPAPLAWEIPADARIRVLAMATRGRGEEAAAIEALAGAGWKLLSETPATLRRQDPRGVLRAGALAWTR